MIQVLDLINLINVMIEVLNLINVMIEDHLFAIHNAYIKTDVEKKDW